MKPPHQRPPTPAVAPSDDSISPALEKQIVDIEQRLESLMGRPADDLEDHLRNWATAAGESAAVALSAAHNAIVFAWASGSLFNLAKEDLGRGPFGPWRDTKAAETGISVRTSQHWMKLAYDCSDVRALLVPGASLTSAYRAAGVLPAPDPAPRPQGGDGEDGDPPPPSTTPPPAEQAFTALAEGRMRLRHLVEAGATLGEEDRDRLEEEKSAFITLVDKLLNPIVP